MLSPAATLPGKIAIGDFDENGLPDIVTEDNGDVWVLLGRPGRTFDPPVSFAVGSGVGALAIDDLNGDGNLDVVAGNSGASSFWILPGDGLGSLGAAQETLLGHRPHHIALSDLNGDGIVDVVTGSQDNGSSNISVSLGEGGGTFVPALTYPADSKLVAVLITDMNLNGKLDIVAGRGDFSDVVVFDGVGDGTFREHDAYAVNGGSGRGLATGDFDADGDADLVSVGFIAGGSGIWTSLNRIVPAPPSPLSDARPTRGSLRRPQGHGKKQ